MIHETYTGKIKDYVIGIEHDLKSVTANESHDLVKDSIMGTDKTPCRYCCS